jgi:DNA modification methylase
MGERGRKVYSGIEQLADSIESTGLVQPIVVEASGDSFLLRAGGRRTTALALLLSENRWDGVLHHAATSIPGSPGYLLANVEADQLTGLLIEISENHNRDDMPWQDDLRLIIRAYDLWRSVQAKANNITHNRGGNTLLAEFGALMGVGYSDIKHGQILCLELDNPAYDFSDCGAIRQAYAKLLKYRSVEIAKLAAVKSFQTLPAHTVTEVRETSVEERLILTAEVVTIPLSSQVHLTDGISFMSQPGFSVDHIITDPDYAVSEDLLNSNMTTAGEGIVQDTVEESLADLRRFITAAFAVTRGFCIFWYDLDHHEKLQRIAVAAGWRVQRWPLIWHKTDARSNAAPNHNFPKNFEYAMVLRKPVATLAKVQSSSIFSFPGLETVRKFGHPYAKPIELHKWVMEAVAHKGETIYDPFAGRGTIPYSAILSGYRPLACEINENHFADLQLNMQGAYRKVIGINVKFI